MFDAAYRTRISTCIPALFSMMTRENAGLISSERRGQFIHYRLVSDNLVNTLNGYLQEVCPVSRPLKRENGRLGKSKV